MATLSGNKIKNTYQSLVKFSDNGNITVGAKQLTDGFGNNSPMFVSTTQVGIGVTPEAGLNLHVYGDAKIGSNLTVIGNLVVEGSTTTVGTDTLTVKDPLIVLANNNTSTDAVDIGFYGKYTPSGTTLYSGLFREALTGKYRLFKGLEVEPTTTVNTSGTGYAVASLVANLEGDVTGNITGNVTGNLTGNVTGNVTGNITGNVTGDLTGDVTGDVTGNVTGDLTGNVTATSVLADGVTATTQSDGDNSTKVATTAYVDTAITGHDTLAEVLAGGNTTGGTDIAVSAGDDITFTDTSKSIYGTGGELEIHHNGSNSYITEDGTGALYLQGTYMYLTKSDGSQNYIELDLDGATDSRVKLNYGGATKLQTTNTGVDVTGNIDFTGNINIGDNQKILFGDSGDVEMFFNGSSFVIDDTVEVFGFDIDTNLIRFRGTDLYTEISNGQHTFWTNGTERFKINATEVKVSHQLNVTGDLIVDTDTLFVDTSEDSVGIGLTNPADYTADELVISVPDDSGMTLVSGTTDTAYIRFADGTAAADQANFISHDHNTNTLTVFSQAKVSIGILEAEVAYFTDTAFYVDKSTTIDDTLTVDGNATFEGNVGIGISPNQNFHIFNSDATALIQASNTSGIAQLQFFPRDGSNVAHLQSIKGVDSSLTFLTGGNSGNSYVPTERMRIDSSGNLSLATATSLDFNVADFAQIKFKESAAITIDSDNNQSSRNFQIKDGSGSSLLFVGDDGNVGIGATNTYDSSWGVNSKQLTIQGTDYGVLRLENDAQTTRYAIGAGDGNLYLAYDDVASAHRILVNSSGNVGIGTTSPDITGFGYTTLTVVGGTSAGYAGVLELGSPTTNANGQNLGIIAFMDGSTRNAQIDVTRESSTSTSNMHFYTNAGSGIEERMRIDSSGNVGIGTSDIDFELQVGGTDLSGTANFDAQFAVLSEATTGYPSGFIFLAPRVATSSNRVLLNQDFGTYFSTQVYATSNASAQSDIPIVFAPLGGNVGIGTTSPDYKLEVESTTDADLVSIKSTAIANNTQMRLGISGNDSVISGTGGSTGNLVFKTYGSERMRIDSSGNVGIGDDTPTSKLTVLGTSTAASNTPSDAIVDIQGTSTAHLLMGVANVSPYGAWINTDSTAQPLVLMGTGGNVGIGTDSPRVQTEIRGLAQATANISDTGNSKGTLQVSDTANALNAGGTILFAAQNDSGTYTPQAAIKSLLQNGTSQGVGDLAFSTRANTTDTALTERMRITSGGDVLIGTNSIAPATQDGFVLYPQGTLHLTRVDDYVLYLNRRGSDGILARMVNDGVVVGGINVTGSSTSYNTSSDYRLKENVVEMTGALDRVSQLKPSRFNFIADADKTVDGFLAHEVQEIVPEAITGEKDGMRTEEYEVSPDVYEDVVHPAEEAVYETVEHPAIEEELDDEGNVVVEAVEAYTEEVLVTEAKEEWTEKVLVTEKVMGTREVPDYQGIDQSKLVPLLVGAIQELKAEIESLKLQINN